MLVRCSIIVLLVTACLTAGAQETQLPSLEDASRILARATVTVRVRNPQLDEELAAQPEAAADAFNPAVTVCSGIVVDSRLVISPVLAASDSEIRITVPGGQQLTAVPRVLDDYTGLALLETDGDLPSKIVRTDDVPAVGSWVLSAAAWGTERPAVSVGILGASQRTLAGTSYPPLLQCDLRTAETSSGAGVVDSHGRLIGVVVATDAEQGNRGWTYAVPAAHIQRLITVRNEERNQSAVVILKRRRPVIGMVLDGDDQTVVVSRVFDDSPAQRAGIRVGDHVIAADGVMIRSVYQAVRPMLYKQPGDSMVFLIERQGKCLEARVVLGGGIELPSAPFANVRQYLRPALDVRQIGQGTYTARRSQDAIGEVSAPQPRAAPLEDSDRPVSAAEKIQLLERALERYQQAMLALHQRLLEEEQQRQQTEEQIRTMQQQIEKLQQTHDKQARPVDAP
jgi:S1-C subfamily serine protease